MNEVFRILKPQSYFFVQIWPMYYSENGGHLWHWDSTPYSHLMKSRQELIDIMNSDTTSSSEVKQACLVDYDTLNKITFKKLCNSLKLAGFDIRKAIVDTGQPVIPPSLNHLPIEDLIISQVKLLAFKN
jgi:hypothetical protein